MREYLFMALISAAVTYLLVPLVRRFAIRIGAMPEVRERDVHTTPTPRLGGLAMYGGLVVGLLCASRLPHSGAALSESDANAVTALIVAGGLITVTGFLDDWWGMDAFIKLGGQIAAAGVLVAYDLRLLYIPLPKDWGGSTSLDYTLSTIITIMVVVVTINAVNFVDGLDGLAAGIVGIAAMATWAYSIFLAQSMSVGNITTTAAIAAVLIGTCVGFLPHNFHPAKIFMGDTGAMLIGLVLASSIVTVTPLDPAAIEDMNKFGVLLPLMLPAAVLVLPLVDLITAVVRRTSQGLSPFAPRPRPPAPPAARHRPLAAPLGPDHVRVGVPFRLRRGADVPPGCAGAAVPGLHRAGAGRAGADGGSALARQGRLAPGVAA
ncbi:MraY family glycosyltransferase [Nonomuraea salmonea]|uniref:MraY family glycosyltransferase n=1 Tax=Nonomuraea salmonea TaxID=46181 RepID=UPI002FECC42A